MTQFIRFLAVTTCAFLAVTAFSLAGGDACCAGGDHTDKPVSSGDPSKCPALVGNYTCPMHHDVISDKPGKCPKCGMDLVLIKKSGDKAK